MSVDALLQGRSPALDLDPLHGRGPGDLHDRAFYADDARLRMGTTTATGISAGDAGVGVDRPGFDLPRVGVEPTRPQSRADQRAPLVPDARNDEDLAVAQTHLAFVRSHNRVVDTLAAEGVPDDLLFERARELVVRHHQWLVRTDPLPRVVDPAVVDDVFTHGRTVFEVGESYPSSRPTMPVEFWVADFRRLYDFSREGDPSLVPPKATPTSPSASTRAWSTRWPGCRSAPSAAAAPPRRTSLVRDPSWRPSLGPVAGRFDMVDLLLFSAGGDLSVLNPLGHAAPVLPVQGGPAVPVPTP